MARKATALDEGEAEKLGMLGATYDALIWLGKQLLEQGDKVEAASAVTLKATAPAKLTPEGEAFLKRKAELVGEGSQ